MDEQKKQEKQKQEIDVIQQYCDMISEILEKRGYLYSSEVADPQKLKEIYESL